MVKKYGQGLGNREEIRQKIEDFSRGYVPISSVMSCFAKPSLYMLLEMLESGNFEKQKYATDKILSYFKDSAQQEAPQDTTTAVEEIYNLTEKLEKKNKG